MGISIYNLTTNNMELALCQSPLYDAEIKYLDANATSGLTAYINTGIIQADDIGSYIRFSPKQTSNDTVLYGVGARSDHSMYFGGPSGKGYYFGWAGVNTSTRPMLTAEKTYDLYNNWLNDRKRKVVGVDDATLTVNSVTSNEFNAPDLNTTWVSDGLSIPIHLFGQCRSIGEHSNLGSWYRIYSAKFSRGHNEIIMDLVPVRKGSVGYMYDKVSGVLLEQQKLDSSAPDFALGEDVTNAIEE